MVPRRYLIVVEVANGRPGTPVCDVRSIEAYSVEEARTQVFTETWGHCGVDESTEVRITLCRPHTVRAEVAAAGVVREASKRALLLMKPVGMVA